MKKRETILKPEIALRVFVSALLISFYFRQSIFLLLPLSVVLWIRFHRIGLSFILLGLAAAMIFHTYFIFRDLSSSIGLDRDRIGKFTVELKEDSFLSSKGRIIYKGNLLYVSDGCNIESSSQGAVLILDTNEREPFYWGQILEFQGTVSEMSDSEEFPYIAFVQGEVTHLKWKSSLFEKRKAAKLKIEEHMNVFTDGVSALFNALFTGSDEYLDSGVKELFRKSGVPHLLALSGFHVAIIVLVLTYLLKKILGKKTALIVSFPFLLVYLFLTGPSPSLFRAVLMYFIGAIVLLIGKEFFFIDLLLVTLVFQLGLSPVQGFSLSFQLSYLALAGILILGKRIYFPLQQWLPSFLALPLSAAMGAHIFTAPLLIFLFRELYPIGLISSLVLTPLIALFMWSSLLFYIVSFIPLLRDLLISSRWILEMLYQWIVKTARWFSHGPVLRFSSPGHSFIYLSIIAIIVLFLYIDIWRINGRRKSTEFKLRFTIGNTITAGNYGIGTKKEVESEFPD